MRNNIHSTPRTDTCLISGRRLEKILDLGMHPYADTFINRDQLGMTEPVLPLECYLCKECGHVQLGYITNDFDRYNLYAYSYTSSNSKFARDHWDAYAETMIQKFDVHGKFVVEIGSNDGYLISKFQKDNKVIGIDSSKEMALVAKKMHGVQTIHELFNSKSSAALKSRFGQADLVMANNVFNHSNDPLDFAKSISTILTKDGVFVFEQPYWLDTIASGKFDQIYHEHVSYFTVKSARYLLDRAGLEIFDVEVVDYHGGSLRVYAQKATGKSLQNSKVKKMIEHETKLGLFKVATYTKFQKDITLKRDKFLSKLFAIKSHGYPIVAVGAAAKGNTFLNFYKLDKTVIDYVTDSSPYKQGKHTPLTRIPIVGDEIFKKYDEVYALVLSWNLSATLKKNLLTINKKIKFI